MTKTAVVSSMNKRLIKVSSIELNKLDSVYYLDGALLYLNTLKNGTCSTRPNLVNKQQEYSKPKQKKTARISNTVIEFQLLMFVLTETVKMATSQSFYLDTISTLITQIFLPKLKLLMKNQKPHGFSCISDTVKLKKLQSLPYTS